MSTMGSLKPVIKTTLVSGCKPRIAIVAGVEDDEVRRPARRVRHRPVEQGDDIAFDSNIGLGAAARGDRLHDLLDPCRRAAEHEHMIAFARQAPAQRGAQPLLGADSCDHGLGGRAHSHLLSFAMATTQHARGAAPTRGNSHCLLALLVPAARALPARHAHPYLRYALDRSLRPSQRGRHQTIS
jgi:hypothetical protein